MYSYWSQNSLLWNSMMQAAASYISFLLYLLIGSKGLIQHLTCGCPSAGPWGIYSFISLELEKFFLCGLEERRENWQATEYRLCHFV